MTVSNIVTFTSRYPAVATFSIVTNRRSRPGIGRPDHERPEPDAQDDPEHREHRKRALPPDCAPAHAGEFESLPNP